MRRVIVLLFVLVLIGRVSVMAESTHKWIAGTLLEIAVVNGPNAGGSYDYTIEAGNRRFVIRSGSSSSNAGSSNNIPVNVGETITFAPEGTRAWVLANGKEYECSVLRQTLLSTGNSDSSFEKSVSSGPQSVSTASNKPKHDGPSGVELPPPPEIPFSEASTVKYNDPLAKLGPAFNEPGQGIGSGSREGTGVGRGAYKVGGGVTPPSVVDKVEPVYSRLAEARGIEGTVVLYAEVDSSGRAVNIRVLRGLGYGLDEQAILAVREWKFRPGYKDGRPVTVVATIEVHFRLKHRPR